PEQSATGVPQARGAVTGGGGDPGSVGRPGQVTDGVGMSGQNGGAVTVGECGQQGTAYDRSGVALFQGSQSEQDGQLGVFLHPSQDVFGDGERHTAQEPVVTAPRGVDESTEHRSVLSARAQGFQPAFGGGQAGAGEQVVGITA